MRRRVCLMIMVLGFLTFAVGGWFEYYKEKVPNELQVRSGYATEFDFSIPANAVVDSKQQVSLNRPFSVTAWGDGSCEMKVQLLGFIPLKTVQVQAVDECYAIPCGCPIGIYMETDGVLVIDSGTVYDLEGNELTPAKNKLQKGDYIEAVNGLEVESKNSLIQAIEACEGEPLLLDVRRKKQDIQIMVQPVMTKEGCYKAGIWVRDDMQGIGTLTYIMRQGLEDNYDSEYEFGALGHGVNDIDTGLLVEAENGELRSARILGITKGSSGVPGSVLGSVDYTEAGKLGRIMRNTECGITGVLTHPDNISDDVTQAAIKVGLKQEAHEGTAYIRSDVSGEMRDYEICITEVHLGATHSTKSLEIQVTDEELIMYTGGIVQGMSGSPIIQDNKLIGAVTHVFVNDPTRGYGIFVEDMMD